MGSAALSEAAKSIRDWSLNEGRVLVDARQRRRHLRQPRVQRQGAAGAAAEAGVPRAARDDYARRAARRGDRRRGRHGAEGLGRRARRHALHALVPADDRHHGREARLVSLADRRRHGDRRVPRQGTDQGRARRVELPVGRHALHVRGARLHGVGSDQPAVAARQRQQRDARDPDGVRELDRRGARQEDAAPALDGGGVEAGGARAQAVRLDRRARVRDLRSRAGVLPDRSQLLFRASRPDQRRPHALRRQAAEGAGDGRSVLRLDSRARARVHGGGRARAVQGRRAGQDAPQRGGAEPVRDRARCSRTPTSPSITR